MKYSKLEQRVMALFSPGEKFIFNNDYYRVENCGKPRPLGGGGECKTDLYVSAINEIGTKLELKISIKSKSTNEFQGNKFTPSSAESLLGVHWKNIISEAARSIKSRFESRELIFIDRKGRTQENSVTMGWKLEVASKPRALSAQLPLNNQTIKDLIYKGTGQDDRKKHASVNGVTIENSGVADLILFTELEELNTIQDVLNSMILIDELNLENHNTYLIFTANNWRTINDKTDGRRCLAVVVKWTLCNGVLTPEIIFDDPLSTTGYENKYHVKEVFSELGIQHPSELDPSLDSPFIYKKDVKS